MPRRRTLRLSTIALLLVGLMSIVPTIEVRARSIRGHENKLVPSPLRSSPKWMDRTRGRFVVANEDSTTSCTGVQVSAGANLAKVMQSHRAGTAYCLAAGTYRVTSPIPTDVGDRVIGAGQDATFIDGTGLPQTAEGIFLTRSHNYFAKLDIFGAPTPTAGSGIYCDGNANCGKAFSIHGSGLKLRSVDCHGNGGACIGGGGNANVTVSNLNCWENGSAYSMTPAFRYAACIKRAAAYDSPSNTTVTNSFIHDNPWVGLWCDHCKYGFFDVEGSTIVHNGSNGIQWEMSGGWTADDRALIKHNVIRGNNYLSAVSFGGGIAISTSNDIFVRSNRFGRNVATGVSIIFTPSRNPPQPDSRGVVVKNNTMNADLIRGCDLAGVTCTDNT